MNPKPSMFVTTESGAVTRKATRFRKPKAVNQSVYDLAIERLHLIYDQFDHVAVAFSGGKDSTVCLQLTLQVAKERNRLPLDVIFFDEEAIPWQTVEYVERVSRWSEVALRWYCLPIKHRNACSRQHPWWYLWDPAEREHWCRPLPAQAITTLEGFAIEPPEARLTNPQLNGLLFHPARHGTVGMVMGIRAQESITRLRMVTARQTENYIVHYTDVTDRGNLWKCYPIYDWKLEDVWTAPAQFGWDYNHAYDVLEQAGLSAPQQRCSPAFGEEPLQKLWTYKTCFPEVWEKMIYRVPGANTAMMYAKTELWGYGAKPELPEDMDWHAFVLHYLQKFDGTSTQEIATRLKREIASHYAKTTDPILPTARHPLTGISWQWLAVIAMRGDLKRRRAPGKDMYQKPAEVWWADYRAELARVGGEQQT